MRWPKKKGGKIQSARIRVSALELFVLQLQSDNTDAHRAIDGASNAAMPTAERSFRSLSALTSFFFCIMSSQGSGSVSEGTEATALKIVAVS